VNIPNLLTLSRMALSVVLIYLLFSPGLIFKCLALTVFVIASLTDYWDGFLARKYNLITPMGQLLDPIADKVLIFSKITWFAVVLLLIQNAMV